MSLKIDGTTYAIPIIEEGRQADLLFKYADRTQDGELHTELIGVYYNYKGMKFGDIYDQSVYNAFYAKLTEAVESHTIELVDHTGAAVEFDCYFANIKDALRREKSGVFYWKDLTIDIIARSPSRTP